MIFKRGFYGLATFGLGGGSWIVCTRIEAVSGPFWSGEKYRYQIYDNTLWYGFLKCVGAFVRSLPPNTLIQPTVLKSALRVHHCRMICILCRSYTQEVGMVWCVPNVEGVDCTMYSSWLSQPYISGREGRHSRITKFPFLIYTPYPL